MNRPSVPPNSFTPLLLLVGWGGCVQGFQSLAEGESLRPSQVAKRPPGPGIHQTAWAYLTQGFQVDIPSQRMAGNLTTLALAFREASSWRPSPATLEEFASSLEFASINLWNPVLGDAGTLRKGEPPDDAPVGSYWTWTTGTWAMVDQETGLHRGWTSKEPSNLAYSEVLHWEWAPAGWRWFAAVTPGVVLQVKEPVNPHMGSAWSASGPPPMDAASVFCRITAYVGMTAHMAPFPGLLEKGDPTPTDWDSLAGMWWVWDPAAMLADPPMPIANIPFKPHKQGGVPDCDSITPPSPSLNSPASRARPLPSA
ncbi:hypothetical protein H8D30_05515 [bacterium]|nr:hypothetical protein [bacterium]